ncbi:MAG: FctA domain-containing protein, partial [Eggerthellaceae bacterium]|nr:FctA domain-containing protein [Eggerthellaceae bacterium]
MAWPAGTAFAVEKTSDGNTTDSYTQNLGDNSSTRYAGRVWTDKTVYTEDAKFSGDVGNVTVKNDSDFLVAYSALATTQNITGKSAVPVDVVFVIDNSNSMDDSVGGGSGQSRLEATVDAVNTSIATIMESHPDSRVAVVLYGSSAHTLMPLGHYSASTSGQHRGNYIWYSSDTYTSWGQSYTDTTFGSVANNQNLEMEYGVRGTNIHMGVDTGMDILKGATNIGEGASKHVPALILLSDGAATYAGSGNWWDPSGSQGIGSEPSVTFSMETAMHAQYQKQLVNNHYGVEADADTSCKIYTIGMGIEQLSGSERNIARLALNPGTYITENNNEANAMETAWNTYLSGQNPTMRYPADTNYWGDTEYSNYTFRHPSSGDISTIAYNDGYYSAENAEDVTNVFDDITSEIVSASAQAPTHIEGDPLESGYLTYTDPIGEYMQVDEVKTLIYGGQRFDNPTKEEINANTTKYTFEGEISSDVYGDLNASKIEITVTKGDDGNETLTVKIPAAAIPLRVNTVDIDENGAITNTNNNAYPARILYTVGAREGVNLETLEGVSDDYISANMTEDGQYVNFYSNKYSGNIQDDSTVGDAKVTFTAAETNPFFYVQEDTPLYTAENTNSPATSVQDNDTRYYFQITYYEGNQEITTWVSRPGSSFWHNGSTDATITTLDGGQVAIKQGAPRLGYLTDFAQSKDGNSTETADQVFHPVYDGNGQFTVYLGNNGVLKADAPKSLTVEKDVTAGEGLTAPDADFTFEVTVATKADTTGDAILTDADGQKTDKELTFDADGKATFTLKDGQSVEILNVGEGVNYTVKETNLPAGFTSDQADNTKTGIVSATDEDNVVTFTNTYNVTEVTTEDLGITLGGTKSITGRDFQTDDEFVFTIAAAQATPNAPLPTEDIDQDGSATTATVNPTSGDEVSFEFGDVTFDKPGEYRYVITENTGTLPGVDYDGALYRVNIIIKDNGDGTLSLASVDGGLTGAGNVSYPTNPFIQIWDGDQTGAVVSAVAFENNYSATEAEATIQGMKVLNSTNSDRILADDDFTFTIEALGYNTDGGDQFNQVPAGDPEQPMPANTEVNNVANGNVIFGEMTFTQDMIGNTYGYKITEKLPQGVDENNPTLNGVTYDTSEKIVKVTVTRSDEGGEEHVVATVTPNDGTAEAAKNFTFTNTYEPSSVTVGEDADDAITVQKTFT